MSSLIHLQKTILDDKPSSYERNLGSKHISWSIFSTSTYLLQGISSKPVSVFKQFAELSDLPLPPKKKEKKKEKDIPYMRNHYYYHVKTLIMVHLGTGP